MPARYHPLYDDIWDDDAWDATPCAAAAPFAEIAFFIFLFGNRRQRPSGIYRATDAQIAQDTRLPLRRVQAYIGDLAARRRIVRDGAWLFVRGYFARQPKHQNLLAAVERQVMECSSRAVLTAFSEKYPHLSQWSDNRRTMVEQRLLNGRPTVERNPSSEQSSTEQSRAEQVTVAQPSPNGPDTPAAVLAWLNAKAGRSYRPVAQNLDLIRARLESGIKPWQLRAIVSRKVREWNHEPKAGEKDMRRYLRPETLFGKAKCEQYVGELPAQREEPEP